MKTATLNMRVDPSVKEEAERVYAQFGMNLTRFNAETEAAMREAREIAAGRVTASRYVSASQAFADVDGE